MANPNLQLLLGIARAMGPLCEQVVFVGGCATGLLVDDTGLMDVRPTEDVDAIVEVATLGADHRLAQQLMQRGFTQTIAGNQHAQCVTAREIVRDLEAALAQFRLIAGDLGEAVEE
jgi:hypothetical protein